MFADKRFALAALTVFWGPNQSGKTTVMDALRMQAFKQHVGNSQGARFLRARYGENGQVALDWQDPLAEGQQGPSPEVFDGLFFGQGGRLTAEPERAAG